MRARIAGTVAGLLALAGTSLVAVPAAQAARVNYCYIAGSYGDNHARFKHGDVFASVDYDWFEEVFLGQVDGVKYFGMTSWANVGTRPYWVNGC